MKMWVSPQHIIETKIVILLRKGCTISLEWNRRKRSFDHDDADVRKLRVETGFGYRRKRSFDHDDADVWKLRVETGFGWNCGHNHIFGWHCRHNHTFILPSVIFDDERQLWIKGHIVSGSAVFFVILVCQNSTEWWLWFTCGIAMGREGSNIV